MAWRTRRFVLRGRRREAGASIVELALIAPVMVLLVFGVLDLGRAYRMDIRLENAAREGAVYAQLHPNRVDCGSTTDDITSRVLAEDAGISSMPGRTISVHAEDLSGVWSPVTGCGDAAGAGGRSQRVAVSAQFEVLTPIVASVVGDTIRITGSADVEVQG